MKEEEEEVGMMMMMRRLADRVEGGWGFWAVFVVTIAS